MDAYVNWKVSEKQMDTINAKKWKDIYVTLIKNQKIILGTPIHDQ